MFDARIAIVAIIHQTGRGMVMMRVAVVVAMAWPTVVLWRPTIVIPTHPVVGTGRHRVDTVTAPIFFSLISSCRMFSVMMVVAYSPQLPIILRPHTRNDHLNDQEEDCKSEEDVLEDGNTVNPVVVGENQAYHVNNEDYVGREDVEGVAPESEGI